jgi:hypothetical protein
MIDEILYAIGIIGTILGIVQGIPWLLGAGPKARGRSLYLYYDCDKKALTEETEYEFSWGLVLFLRKIFLVKTSPSTECRLSFKSAIGPKSTLPRYCFVFKKAGSKDKVMLVRNDFFEEREIEKIYVQTITPENEGDYLDKINVVFNQRGIVVENRNDVEIRNYLVTLPTNITSDKAINLARELSALGLISDIIVPELNAQANTPLKIKVRKIEPKQGDAPFILPIPYLT